MAANSEFVFPFGSDGISPVNPSLFPNGSAAAPSISFINDPQSGRYLIGTDNVGESINGSLVFDWNASRLLLGINLLFSGAFNIGNGSGDSPVNIWAETSLNSPLLTHTGGNLTVGPTSTHDLILRANNINSWRVHSSTNALLAMGNFNIGNAVGDAPVNIFFETALIGPGTVADAGDIRLANNKSILWRNAANSGNLGLVLNASDILTTAAGFDALNYRVGGVAGVSFGPAAVASITVVNGIVTAIS